MQCNIGAKGKAVRMKGGIFTVAIGLVIAALTLFGVLEPTMGWPATGAAIFGGGFAIFEARKGWCIVRAMGFKTPL